MNDPAYVRGFVRIDRMEREGGADDGQRAVRVLLNDGTVEAELRLDPGTAKAIADDLAGAAEWCGSEAA